MTRTHKKSKCNTNDTTAPSNNELAAGEADEDARMERAVQAYLATQATLDSLSDQLMSEISEVDKRALAAKQPLLDKRTEAIGKIPGFWLTVVRYF
jgi:hypothetical protein